MNFFSPPTQNVLRFRCISIICTSTISKLGKTIRSISLSLLQRIPCRSLLFGRTGQNIHRAIPNLFQQTGRAGRGELSRQASDARHSLSFSARRQPAIGLPTPKPRAPHSHERTSPGESSGEVAVGARGTSHPPYSRSSSLRLA